MMDPIRTSMMLKKPDRVIEYSYWLGMIGITIVSWLLPLSTPDRTFLTASVIGASVYLIGVTQVLRFRFGHTPNTYILMVSAILMIALASRILDSHAAYVENFYITVIAAAGILIGRRLAIQALVLTLMAEAMTLIWPGASISYQAGGIIFQLLALAVPGFVICQLSGMIYHQISTSDRQNQDLSFLFRTAQIAYESDDLPLTLTKIAGTITRHFRVNACQICLYDSSTNQLKLIGAYPLPHFVQGVENSPISNREIFCDFGEYWQNERILTKLELSDLLAKQASGDGFWHDIRSLYLLPLTTNGGALGLLAISDTRDWNAQPFGAEQLDLMRTLAAQTSVIIRNTQLSNINRNQAIRNAVLNDVAKAMGSTIEFEPLLELIFEQLCKVLPSDTYYVSLYDQRDSSLDIRILIDEGERFQPRKIPLGQGLASLVISTSRPLLIRHLSQEIDTLPIQPIILGSSKLSESWLGAPMLHGSEVLGLLAIASYQPYAFQEEDITLLSNLAIQAALAIDNASHHAEVEEQANRDSLTQAYNHGFLLQRLNEMIEISKGKQTPVSLIMLDIDYFKAYNDRYGHLIGDEVLVRFVKAIKIHIKKTDTVGRWGGEEFAVLLPGASPDQAYRVAERIRESLAEIELNDQKGARIPPPTASQGIATFPTNVDNASQLIDVTDKALYIAKHRGRDQIQTWENEDLVLASK